MATHSFLVAISPTAAYYTAVTHWGWNCEFRNIPVFQTKTGNVVKFVQDHLFNRTISKIKDFDIDLYLGIDWRLRDDAKLILRAIEFGNVVVRMEINKNGQ